MTTEPHAESAPSAEQLAAAERRYDELCHKVNDCCLLELVANAECMPAVTKLLMALEAAGGHASPGPEEGRPSNEQWDRAEKLTLELCNNDWHMGEIADAIARALASAERKGYERGIEAAADYHDYQAAQWSGVDNERQVKWHEGAATAIRALTAGGEGDG